MRRTKSVTTFGVACLTISLATTQVLAQDITVPLTSPNAEAFGSFGYSVSGAGDVNDDGYTDVVVGAVNEDVGQNVQVGRAYVFAGPEGDLLYTLVSPNSESSGFFGYSVSGAGDVNGDGNDDVIVGAPNETVGELEEAGRAYVFSGATGALLYTLVSPNPEFSGFFGGSVSGVGDVDDDGRSDLVVSALETVDSANVAGRVYVFSGEDGALLHTLASPNAEARVSLPPGPVRSTRRSDSSAMATSTSDKAPSGPVNTTSRLYSPFTTISTGRPPRPDAC